MSEPTNDDEQAAAAVLAEAERVIAPRRVVWVPKLADPTRPTSDEINAGVELDPRWNWVEVREFGEPGPTYIRGLCNHLPREVVPVESAEGETVAHLCQTCDTQLPAEWTP